MAGLADFVDESNDRELHVMSVEYEEHFGEPIIHLFCRDRNNNFEHVEVEGHKPSFYIESEAATTRIKNHDWVEGVEGGYESIHGHDLARVETRLPWHVGGKDGKKGLREYFEQTWEADVFYTSRFLIDTGIKTHVRIDQDAAWTGTSVDGNYRVHVDDIEAVADPSWRAEPRVITIDIEVLSPDGFPNPQDANQPVTAITAYDSHTEDYTMWVLRYEGWGHSDTEVRNLAIENCPDGVNIDDVGVFQNESQMLDNFNRWIADRRPDLLSGWNSSTTDNGRPFDYPYIIHRCQSLNVMSHQDWSPMGRVWDGNWGPGGKGVEFFDMLKGYKKTQWQKPKGGYSLSNIADNEGVAEKLDIEDIDRAWQDDADAGGLETFLEYNVRDVQAVVGIDQSAGVVELFQNIRALTGAQFDNCHNNIDLLDVFILRYAKEMGVALPTNEEPDRDWYYGARVFDSQPGRHRYVPYFDVSSLYPNVMYQTNMSPETIIGTERNLAESEYTESDCCWSYIDTRPTNVKETTDPQYEKCYFLKPSVEEGFIRGIIQHLLELKDQYDGTDLYDAVKRIVNSIYGIMGDSNSYGKGFRLYDWRLAESVTLQGRKIITEGANFAVEEIDGGYITNGDTDGVGVAMPNVEDREAAVQQALSISDDMTEHLQQWCLDEFSVEESTIVMETEKLMDPLFIPSGVGGGSVKKRYAYLNQWEE